MTPTLTAVLASAIVVLAALLLYVRHVVRQEIHAAEERLRDDLIATRIISSPPEPPVPRPRPALRYIKGGAVALFGLAAGTLAWTRRHAALTAVTAGGLAAIVVLPQVGPPDVEGLPQAIPPSTSTAPSSPPANDPPTEVPPTPPTEPPVTAPPPTEASATELVTTAPPSEEPASAPTPSEEPPPPGPPPGEPAPMPPAPPPAAPPVDEPPAVEPPAVEDDAPPCLLELAAQDLTVCVDLTLIVQQLPQLVG